MAQNGTRGWDPARTWVFVVGTLEWKHADYFPPFPTENRRDAQLVELLRTQGVADARICYLQDRQATTRRIQQQFEAHLKAAAPGDLAIVYYCGHGAKTDDGAAYFASYDADGEANPGWVVDSIPATIARCFGGSRVLVLADCCYSGCLLDAIARHGRGMAYACIASSLASELSTGNWTFTEGVLSGLRGQAFVDGDSNGVITLRELAGQIAESMAFAEEQIAPFGTSGGFDPEMVLAAGRPRPGPQVGRRVEVRSGGDWYRAQIIDERGDQLKVHFYGYEDSDDEWVDAGSIRALTFESYPVGAAVEVRWKRKWYPARVLDVHAGIHHIHYQGYDSSWDEWVSAKRIRPAT